MQDHTPQNAYICQQAPPNQKISPLEGYSESKALELSRKSKRALGKAERWYVMWDILFPEHPRPRSPYLDPALSKEVNLLCDYIGEQMVHRQYCRSFGELGQYNNFAPTGRVTS
ncbi:hypothetical protein K456DRAFT_58906 [Colletotrichum gloeosporioides 23]|nr:hypothetical protein K456DRAFT_58906 [Colletotrichum gloeosporioides 23]